MQENHNELTRTIEPETKPETEPETVKMSPGKRIISLFVAPGELMSNIKARPVFLVPFLLAVVIGLVTVVPNVRVTEMYERELSNISIERYGRDFFDMSALANEYGEIPMAEAMTAITWLSHIAMAFILPLIACLLYAVGLFILSKILRGKAKFGQLFSMCMHIYAIFAVGALVVASLMSLTGSLLDMTTLAAVFARNGTFDQLSYNIFSGIGIFPIWSSVLAFIGVKVLGEFCNVKAGIIAGVYFLAGLTVHIVSYMSIWWMYDVLIGAGLM
ncbi:MAG: YIP1 family protein [Defluviitaleaceae bacterium]|nr:YIP1 family protein [Defluviitaleaceae bacterium]